MAPQPESPSVLVIGCGALARELIDIVASNNLRNVRIECLPAILHNSPQKIAPLVRERLERATGYDRIFVAYADCGTGGQLDSVIDEFDVERLDGAHCYQFFAGRREFEQIQEAEIGTLYLTDYLARHFDRFVWKGLGLDRHPELRDDYFGNYTRVLYLAQTDDPERTEQARHAANRLGLRFERRFVGYGEMEPALVSIASQTSGSGYQIRSESADLRVTGISAFHTEGGQPPSNPPTGQAIPTSTLGSA
ncbi:MAG: DUF1638 domain-containing protein [Acidimicrobiia bacterium]